MQTRLAAATQDMNYQRSKSIELEMVVDELLDREAELTTRLEESEQSLAQVYGVCDVVYVRIFLMETSR